MMNQSDVLGRGLGIALVMAGLCGVGSGHASAQPETAQPEAAQPEAQTPVEVHQHEIPTEFTSANQLLEAIDARAGEQASISGLIQYVRVFTLAGDVHIRRGDFAYAADGAPSKRRRFAVSFDQLQIGTRLQDERRRFAFDGQYLLDMDENARTFSKVQILRPGEPFDAISLGQGPFPIPIGQSAANITRSYSVSLPSPAEGLDDPALGSLTDQVAGLVQLKLVPRPGTRASDDVDEVRVWYNPIDLLPRVAMTVELSGDLGVVQFFQLETGVELEPTVFSTAVPAGYDGTIRDLQRADDE